MEYLCEPFCAFFFFFQYTNTCTSQLDFNAWLMPSVHSRRVHLARVARDETGPASTTLYAGYTLIVSRISTCSCNILWTILWDCEPITIHFSISPISFIFDSARNLMRNFPYLLFDVSWKYRLSGENGKMRDEKNDWRDGLRNAIYTLIVSLILPTFFRILVNLMVSV